MTRRGPSRRRLSGSLRRGQGSAPRADPVGADGLDRASSEPMASSCAMAPSSDPVECGVAAIESVNRPSGHGSEISIVRCRELLGDEADSLTDHDIAEIWRHAGILACIVIDMYEKYCKIRE
jgi:hypothetical protein